MDEADGPQSDRSCRRFFKRYLLHDARYLIMDRDPLFTVWFRGMLKNGGTKPVRLPARSPDLNAFAERFVLSLRARIKSECLNKIIPPGEKHLRLTIKEYMEHYRGLVWADSSIIINAQRYENRRRFESVTDRRSSLSTSIPHTNLIREEYRSVTETLGQRGPRNCPGFLR